MAAYHEIGITNELRRHYIILSDRVYAEAHWHNELELLYVMEGSCEVVVDGEKFIVEPDRILIINSNEVHSIKPYKNKMLIIQLGHLKNKIDIDVGKQRKFKQPIISSEQSYYNLFMEQIREILLEYNQGCQGFEYALEARCWDIMKLIVRFMDTEAISRKNVVETEVIKKIFSYIEAHYREPISISMIASGLGYNESYFSRMFKKMTGVNFNWFINNKRIEYSKNAIRDKKFETIADVAYDSGFNSIQTFNRVFKETVGKTPKEYKKAFK